jgi:hypothetical protein
MATPSVDVSHSALIFSPMLINRFQFCDPLLAQKSQGLKARGDTRQNGNERERPKGIGRPKYLQEAEDKHRWEDKRVFFVSIESFRVESKWKVISLNIITSTFRLLTPLPFCLKQS